VTATKPMRYKSFRLFGLVGCLLLFSFSAFGQKYIIRFHHPDKTGSKYHLSARGDQATRVKLMVANQTVRANEDRFALALSADVTVLETNPAGWATRKAFTILDSRFAKGTEVGPLLPRGTIVLASIENGETIYHVADKRVDDEIATALRWVISLHVAGVDDDELFGTKQRKAVGQTWKVDVKAINKLLNELKVEFGDAQITGGGVLEKVDKGNLQVRCSFSVKNIELPPSRETIIEGSEMYSEMSGKFPIRQTSMEQSSINRLLIRTVGRAVNKDKAETKVQTESESNWQFEITPVTSALMRK